MRSETATVAGRAANRSSTWASNSSSDILSNGSTHVRAVFIGSTSLRLGSSLPGVDRETAIASEVSIRQINAGTLRAALLERCWVLAFSETKHEPRAAVVRTLKAHRAAVRLRDVLHDREPESRPR